MLDASALRNLGFEKIGTVGVDSGQLIFVDPCYVLPDNSLGRDEIEPRNGYDVTYDGVLDYYDRNKLWSNPERFIEPWGDGLGLIVSTAYGDGVYAVYARYIENDVFGGPRVIGQVLVDFVGDLVDDDSEPFIVDYDDEA